MFRIPCYVYTRVLVDSTIYYYRPSTIHAAFTLNYVRTDCRLQPANLSFLDATMKYRHHILFPSPCFFARSIKNNSARRYWKDTLGGYIHIIRSSRFQVMTTRADPICKFPRDAIRMRFARYTRRG